MLYPNQTIHDRESAMQADIYQPGKSEAYHYFASAGGFSNYFSRPKYQAAAVEKYLTDYNPGYDLRFVLRSIIILSLAKLLIEMIDTRVTSRTRMPATLEKVAVSTIVQGEHSRKSNDTRK